MTDVFDVPTEPWSENDLRWELAELGFCVERITAILKLVDDLNDETRIETRKRITAAAGDLCVALNLVRA